MTGNDMKFSFQLKFDSLFEFSAPAYDDRHISYLLTEAQFRVFIKRYNPMGNKYQKGFEGNEQRRRDLEQLIKPASISGSSVTGAITYAGTTVINTKIITIPLGTRGLIPGIAITGTNIPALSTITDISGPTTIVISANATATGATTLTSGMGLSSSQGGVHPIGIFLDLPNDFLYAVEEACTLKIEGGSARTVESWIKPVRHDEYLANINNPYKKPYKDLVWRMDMSRAVHADGTDIMSSSKRTELIIPTGYDLVEYRTRYLAMPPAIKVDEFDPTQQKHCVLDETLHREIVDEAVAIAQAAVKKEEYQIGRAESQQSE
jgi:hypothetical protein